jgi:hypothetical protein
MALPLILGALSAIPQLFDAGRQVYEAVTGKPSAAASPAELRTEIMALPADQQGEWAKNMEQVVAMHRAETDRIRNEQGEVTPELLQVLDRPAAAQVALARMTTRPWIVRRCTHVILLPVYVTAIDTVFMVLNGLWRAFGADPVFNLFAEKLFGDGSIYVTMYQWAAPTAATVVITYITARAVEKANGGADGLTATIGRAAAAVRSLVKR